MKKIYTVYVLYSSRNETTCTIAIMGKNTDIRSMLFSIINSYIRAEPLFGR